jgi:hypothetical protein
MRRAASVRFVFVNCAHENHGSAQDIHSYAQVARRLGHEVALYGPPAAGSAFPYSREVGGADAVVFIFEFATYLDRGDHLDWVRLVGRVPRARRVVIDCDGKYNDALGVAGDTNHADAAASRRWIGVCDSLADKICQPALRPLRPNVRPFLFHAYNPRWERPLDFSAKAYGLVYVGNNWFRWRALGRVLGALEPVRAQVGRIALVGNGWDRPAPWANPSLIEDAYYTESAYLRAQGVEVVPAVRFDRVVDWMGAGVCSPVLLRPLFDRLGLVTCRTFETPAAGTIPLFAQDAAYVRAVYGAEAEALVLAADPAAAADQIVGVLRRPDAYAGVVRAIRRHLAAHHSYEGRLRELIRIVEN